MSENEQVYEFQPPKPLQPDPLNPGIRFETFFVHSNVEPPKPYHPQSRFGSGIQAADRAYPNLYAYYGEGFQVNFTTWDILDSLAARQKLTEDTLEVLQQPYEGIYQALRQSMLNSEGAGEATLYKPSWWRRLLRRK